MYQAYAGKVLNGKPAILENVELPENASLLITILNEWPVRTNAQRQGDAIRRFMKAIAEGEEQFTAEDYTSLENNRADFTREVDL